MLCISFNEILLVRLRCTNHLASDTDRSGYVAPELYLPGEHAVHVAAPQTEL